MTDHEVLKIFADLKARSTKQLSDLCLLKAQGVIFEDGPTLDERIRREFDAEQHLERAMRPIRDRIAQIDATLA